MDQKYTLQQLNISSDWIVIKNDFYEIDLSDNISNDDKYYNIYCQEDLLSLMKGNYHLDLGWYGSDNLADDNTGYCIYLFRGVNWNNAALLEKICSKSEKIITEKIAEFTKAVDSGVYENLSGYKVDENDSTNNNNFNDFYFYTVREAK